MNEFGAIDIWVNNAGMYPNTPLLEITDEHWDRVVNLNLRGTFIGAREAAKRMVETGTAGVIVNISSTGAFNASSGANSAHYIASKHGVAGLTKSLATELGPHGIRAVAVAPTLSETPGVQANRERGLGDVLDAYGSRLPLGRLGKPDDVAPSGFIRGERPGWLRIWLYRACGRRRPGCGVGLQMDLAKKGGGSSESA